MMVGRETSDPMTSDPVTTGRETSDRETTDRSGREPTGRAGREPAAPQPTATTTTRRRSQYRRGPVDDNAGWAVFSYLISGMIVYGLVGWLVSRLTHIGVLFPVGTIVGLVMAIVLVILKYGRP